MNFFKMISTHAPLAGRDLVHVSHCNVLLNFNPRAPCGARQKLRRVNTKSIRFQPTRPLRGAT